MPIFINLNQAHIRLLLSHHFISWLWGLLFLWWDPFCHHKDQGTGLWTNTGKEELQTEHLTFARPRPAADLGSSETGSGAGKAGRQMPSNQGDGLGNVPTMSSMLLSELLSSDKVVLSGLKMPHVASTAVKTGESTWERVSFQIKEYHQEDSPQITYCFSWIAEKPSLASVTLISRHAGEENRAWRI